MTVLRSTKPQIKLVRIDKIASNEYQRPLDSTRVTKIAREYDPILRRAPILTENSTPGYYNVVDGQHTLAAERLLGMNAVWCEVKYISEEALTFVGLNKSQKRIAPLDEYRALVIAEEDPYYTMHEVLANHGFSLGASASTNVAACVTGLMRSSKLYGADVAASGVIIAAQAFGRDSQSYQNQIPVAISSVIGKNPHINIQRLTSILSSTPRGRIVDRADKLRAQGVTTNASESARVTRVIAEVYNKGLTGKARVIA